MSRVFVLGPSEWKRRRAGPTPLAVRRTLLSILRRHGHRAFIMEDEAGRPGEELAEKFVRILRERRPTCIMVYWPASARMPTTLAELVALRFRWRREHSATLLVLFHRSVASAWAGTFDVLESEGRIAYLRDLARRGARLIAWRDRAHLERIVDGLGASDFEE